MMFYLHRLSDQVGGLNVFFYVTFRAVAAAVTAFALSLIIGNFVIRKLISLKIGQPIRSVEEVRRLAELHGGKQGTPTMGGLLIAISIVIPTLLWADLSNRFVWIAVLSTCAFAAIGLADDYTKVAHRRNLGLTARAKLGLQILTSVLIAVVLIVMQGQGL